MAGKSAARALSRLRRRKGNARSCILADPGYFVDVTGAVEQIPCPAGTTSTAGATACTLAVDNTAPTLNVAKEGQTIPLK